MVIIKGVIFVVIGYVSFFIGTAGFAQIIGSLRNRQKNFIMPIIVWTAILIGAYILARSVIPEYMNAFYIGIAISFVVILLQKKIE